MEELLEEVRGITLQRLNEYLESRLLAPPTIVTFGPASLEVPLS